MRTLATYLRGLDPHLPRTVWLVQAGGVVNALGNGIVFPFAIIYLHNVRGISFAQAGFALAIGGASALAAGLLAGPLVDRIGGRNTLVFGLIVQLVAFTLFPLIREPWHAYRAVRAGRRRDGLLLARPVDAARAADAAGSPALGLCAPAREHEPRHRARRRDRWTDRHHGRSGQFHQDVSLRRGDLPRLRDRAPGRCQGTARRPSPRSTRSRAVTGAVLRDRNFLALTGLNVLFVAVGYEVFALLPPFAKNYAGVSEHWVGLIWLANTLLIVLIQLPVSKALEGRRRMAALALMNVLWAAASLIVLAGGGLLNGTSAALVFMTATMVFARRRDAARARRRRRSWPTSRPSSLRGRYFALSAMSWSAGSILGPAVGGPLLGWHPLAVWPSRPGSACSRPPAASGSSGASPSGSAERRGRSP